MKKDIKYGFLIYLLFITFCLFLNIFSMKVQALDLGTPDTLMLSTDYHNGQLGSSDGYSSWFTRDIAKFKLKESYFTDSEYEYNIVANYSGQANIRARAFTSRHDPYYEPASNHYFVFSVYSRIQLENVSYFVGDDTALQVPNISCRIFETVSSSDSPHYFYNFNCDTDNISRAIYYIGIHFDNFDNRLYSPIAFGISNYYSFSGTEDANTFFENLVDVTSSLTNEDVAAIDDVVRNILGVLENDEVDNNQANTFFEDFTSSTPNGLVTLIQKPLDFLNSLYTTCSPINVYIPYFNFNLTLPCISTIHNDIFDTIIPIAKIIINGLICYRIALGFINVINKLKDPNDSDIEVIDL